jgi:hypothetical protein
MVKLPLTECWHKLDRANEHLKALDKEIGAFLENKPARVICEYDSQPPRYLFKVKIEHPIPQARWALIIGDCVHNLRSALDYIAWRLAGSDLTDRVTLFPICESLEQFEKSRQRRLSRVHSDAIAEVERCQPYNRRDPYPSALSTLQELDARDKHKLLATTYMFNVSGSVAVRARLPAATFSPNPTCEHDSVIAELPFSKLAPGSPNPQVKVDADFAFEIGFEHGSIGPAGVYSVRETLQKIATTVHRVLSHFDTLVRNPRWARL